MAWAFLADTELYFDHVFNDATAWSLAEGRGFTASLAAPHDPAIFRPPGYPTFVAAAYALAGHSVRAAFVANALLDTLSCFLLWRLAAARLGPVGARVVLLLAATYPFTIWAVGTLSSETLLVFLGLALVALVERWPPLGRPGLILGTGVVAAALAWVKPVFLPLPAFLLAAEVIRGRLLGVSLRRAGLVAVVSAALFAPWVARNVAAFERPLLTGEFGIVLWHGTLDFHADLEGMVARNFEAEQARPGDRYERTRRYYARSRLVLEDDDEYLRRGLAEMRAHPVRAFALDPLRRAPRLWVSTSHRSGAAWIGWAAAAACVAYLLLAAAGLWSCRAMAREWAAWWVLPGLLTITHAALHVEARYTLPARATLLFLGGAALAAPWSRSGGLRAPRRSVDEVDDGSAATRLPCPPNSTS